MNWLQKIARPQYAPLGEEVYGYRGEDIIYAEGIIRSGFKGPMSGGEGGFFYTTDLNRACLYASFNGSTGTIFEFRVDSSRSMFDANDTTTEQFEEAVGKMQEAAWNIVKDVSHPDITVLDMERYIGSMLGGEDMGYNPVGHSGSVWAYISEQSRNDISINQAREMVPPGYYTDAIVLDERGMFGLTDDNPTIQSFHSQQIPPGNFTAIYLPTHVLDKFNIPWEKHPSGVPQNGFQDTVAMIPGSGMQEDVTFALEDYMESVSEDDEVYEYLLDLQKEIKSFYEYQDDSITIDGHIFRKLQNRQTLTVDDFHKPPEGYVRFDLPAQKYKALLIIRKWLS